MINFIQAFKETVIIIKLDEPHQDYKHVVDYAKKCWRLSTGEETGELLQQFTRRESQEAFDQRCALTSLITPAIINSVNNEFYKAGRSDNVVEVIEYSENPEEKTSKDNIEVITNRKDNFYGNESVNDFLSDEMVDLISYDPNSFVLIEFDPFDATKEKPIPRPRIIRSKDVFNFKYQNNNLEYLIEKTEVQSMNGENSERFILIGRQYSASFTEVEEVPISDSNDLMIDTTTEEEPLIEFDYQENSEGVISRLSGPQYLKARDKTYLIEYYNHTAPFVPAFRSGYNRDKSTHGRTRVTNWHAGMPWFNKMMKAGSEMDLSVALHVFPQKISYERGCPGSKGKRCDNGKDPNGNTCTTCNGTGYVDDHTSAQDVIKFRLPNLQKNEQFLDLSKLIAYITPDINLVKWLDEYVDKLEVKFKKSVFNSDTFDKETPMKTATENMLDRDNIYDALFPYTQWYSSSWMKIMNSIAVFTDTDEGLTLIHEFGYDLKFETEGQLIAQINMLEDSNAPYFIKQHTTQKLANLIHKDNPMELKKFSAKQEHTPFIGKTENEIIFLLSSSLVPKETKVLYSNIDMIFDGLEEDFYMMDYDKQKEILDQSVAEIITKIDEQSRSTDPLEFDNEDGQ